MYYYYYYYYYYYDDGAGEIQLWYCEMSNEYSIYASRTAGYDELVCELLETLRYTVSVYG